MDTWESHFRETSKRRWSRHSREKAARVAVLVLLLAGVAAAAVLLVAGLPQ